MHACNASLCSQTRPPHLKAENVVLRRPFPKAYALDGVEALRHVGLHRSGVSGLRKDLQQLVVRQEEKPVAL